MGSLKLLVAHVFCVKQKKGICAGFKQLQGGVNNDNLNFGVNQV